MILLASALAASHYPQPAFAPAYEHHAPAVLASSQSSSPVLPACACQSGNRTTQGAPQPARQPLTAAERVALLQRRRAVIAARFAALANGRQRNRAAVGTVTDENGQPVALFHPSPRRGSLLCADSAEPILAPAERRAVRLAVALDRDRIEWELGRASPCRWLVALPAVPTLAPRGGCGRLCQRADREAALTSRPPLDPSPLTPQHPSRHPFTRQPIARPACQPITLSL